MSRTAIWAVLILAAASGCTGDDILPAVPDAMAGDGGAAHGLADELPEYVPSAGNLANREWFREARFGLFIHWGIYAALGRGEWVLQNERMRLETYRELAPRFYPVLFNASEWVALAQEAGIKYITLTAKHHDGFGLWHTKQTKWNVVDGSPFGRDILRELAEACRVGGLKLFVYYSPLDWSHPDYYPRGFTGTETGREEKGNWRQYLDYMHRQLEEILTEYPDIAGIWLDGWWDKPSHETWQTEET
ncbi:alpha-L-fucosidase-domain-containing protein [Baffinella frigidus]|nr:alpha-L-fucosidase-domain-containing protein [Cryptophyta sp. CCMP2293]